MSRKCLVLALGLISAWGAGGLAWAQQEPVFSRTTAERHGLERAWISQVELDRSQDRVINLVLDILDQPDPSGRVRDALFTQTNRGLVQAIDAETGRTLWVTQTGNREIVNLAPSANDEMVMCINGSLLCCLDRADGHTIWEKSLKRVPSQPPSMGPDLVFVPALSGHMSVYELPVYDQQERAWVPSKREARNVQSFSRIDVPPLVTRQCLAWGTSHGSVFVCDPEEKSVRFRFDTRAAISAPLGYWPPLILAASRDGYIYAVDALTGESPWRYSSGSAIDKQPIAINGRVYFTPEVGGMFCLSVEDGKELWIAPRATQFVAAGQDRLYVSDRIGQILVLDAKGGGQLDVLPTEAFPIKVYNTQTDRIYMASATGLITCLHEQGRKQPLVHRWPEPGSAKPEAKPAPAGSEEPAEEPAAEEPAEEATGDEEAM